MLTYLAKSVRAKAKGVLHDIWMAASRADAESSLDHWLETYEPKYPRAAACLGKDRDALLAFYDVPAERWIHIRTRNVIESTFATVRHRSDRMKGCVTRTTMLSMIYKMSMWAEQSWRMLKGFTFLAKVYAGVNFKDGVEVTGDSKAAA